jgi:hypothetical protein
MNTTLHKWENHNVVQWGGFAPLAECSQSTIRYAISRLQEQPEVKMFEKKVDSLLGCLALK